jgi:hypothetical protein
MPALGGAAALCHAAPMIRIGTLCYVDGSCIASPMTQQAVCRIVEVVSAPYAAPHAGYLPGTYYDVAFEGWTFYCRSDKLRPISDPGADVGADTGESLYIDEKLRAA